MHASCTFSHLRVKRLGLVYSCVQHRLSSETLSTPVFPAKLNVSRPQSFVLEGGELNLQRELKVDPQNAWARAPTGWTRTTHVRCDLLRPVTERKDHITQTEDTFNSNLMQAEQQYINITAHGGEKWLFNYNKTSENPTWQRRVWTAVHIL